jgi:GH25 family lysozyme M1 (1,4-beta-N-acetylmuramidase)
MGCSSCEIQAVFVRSVVALAISVAAPCLTPTTAQTVPGIDVSHWQGSINWNSVKNSGVQFAFVKATEGIDYVDPQFHANMQGAKAAGVHVGAYHFCRLDSYATDPNDAINEANDFLESVLPYYQTGTYLPMVADVERFPSFGSTAEARAFTSTWVQKFSDTIYNAIGVRPIVYQSLSKANSYYTPTVASSHELWLAWWKYSTANPPVASDTPLWGEWQFWQWTDSWSVPGVAGNVDGDLFNGSSAELSQLLLGNDGAIPGDFNRDGGVDTADYIVWKKTKGMTVPIYSGADANGNARIDAGDIVAWKGNLGQPGQSGLALESHDAAVPEPGSLLISLVAGCLANGGARRRADRDLSRVAGAAIIRIGTHPCD